MVRDWKNRVLVLSRVETEATAVDSEEQMDLINQQL